MAQERKMNIMLVELAIKRELAYRDKLARLNPDDDCIKNLLPLEVPTSAKASSPNLGSSYSLGQSSFPAVNHQIPIPNPPCQKSFLATTLSPNLSSTDVLKPNSVSGPLQNLSSIPTPGPGSCPVSDLTKVASHQVPSSVASLKPLSVENQHLTHSTWPNPDVAPTDSAMKEKETTSCFRYPPQPFHSGNCTKLFCKVCKVNCSSSFNYEQHVTGHKHKAKLKMQRRSRKCGVKNNLQQPRCNLCQIWCTDESTLKLHLDGQKHKTKLKETKLHQQGIAPRQLWCELCQVSCTNENSLRMHLSGKRHIARLCASGEKKNRASWKEDVENFVCQ